MCTTAHPVGCRRNIQNQLDYVRSRPHDGEGPRRVLIVGASSGYGLSSRISCAFGYGSATVGVFYERPGTPRRCATAGWYNAAAVNSALRDARLFSRDFNGDAFSDEVKDRVIELIADEWGAVDLLVYSLAAPRRQHPHTGQLHQSVLKPIGDAITSRTLDTDRAELAEISIDPASDREIEDTVAVMGGEDWQLWISALSAAGLLADGFKTMAYTYIGDRITWPIYGQATIGAAKKHLDSTAEKLRTQLAAVNGDARIAVLKAVATQASAAIPIMPLYLSLLFRVMKERGTHEGCIEQIDGLLAQIYSGDGLQIDQRGRYRRDGEELKSSVQREIESGWAQVTTENLLDTTDFTGYRRDFLQLFGFELPDVDYSADQNPEVDISGLIEVK